MPAAVFPSADPTDAVSPAKSGPRPGPLPAPLAPWPRGVLQLTTLLALAEPPAVRQRLAELHRRQPRPHGAELLAGLYPLAVQVVQGVALAMAEAVGLELGEFLQFADPQAAQAALRGRHAHLRRLDRLWGGSPLLAIEALEDLRLRWPGPMIGCAVVLRGTVRAAGLTVPAAAMPLPIGLELELEAGAVVMLRRSVVGTLLEAVREAGLAVAKVIADAAGTASVVGTPAGRLALHGLTAELQGRKVRLTSAEAQALRLLVEMAGQPVARGAFGANIEHVVLNLRNKLGDGLISTIYGLGYALETSD